MNGVALTLVKHLAHLSNSMRLLNNCRPRTNACCSAHANLSASVTSPEAQATAMCLASVLRSEMGLCRSTGTERPVEVYSCGPLPMKDEQIVVDAGLRSYSVSHSVITAP